MCLWEGVAYYAIYCSLVKKGPVSNIRPPPIIALIYCKGLKFTPKAPTQLARAESFRMQHVARLA